MDPYEFQCTLIFEIIVHLHFLSCDTGVRDWTICFFEVAYFLLTCTLQGAVHGVLMVLMMKMRLARSKENELLCQEMAGRP